MLELCFDILVFQIVIRYTGRSEIKLCTNKSPKLQYVEVKIFRLANNAAGTQEVAISWTKFKQHLDTMGITCTILSREQCSRCTYS